MVFNMVVPGVREWLYTRLFTCRQKDTLMLADTVPESILCLANVESVADITCVFIYKA